MKSKEEGEIAELQINKKKEPVAYDTREYPVEVLIEKFMRDEFVIPSYQRAFVWGQDKTKMSWFIESIILDLPVPYLFFADDLETGKLEIVDGSQRIRTLLSFYKNEFKLEGLEVLDLLNGFRYSDLLASRQRRFLRKTLRSIELTEKASPEIRKDLFARINTNPMALLPMEVRKGAYSGKFYDFIAECARNPLFNQLCPIPKARKERGEAEELVLRYFAYCDKYQNFVHRVDEFLDDYMKEKSTHEFNKEKMCSEFKNMLTFVSQHFPAGFKKTPTSQTIARVRYEAISVGVTLALREKPNLIPVNVNEWLESEEFKEITTSDASNNKAKVIGRIEYVKNKLLRQ